MRKTLAIERNRNDHDQRERHDLGLDRGVLKLRKRGQGRMILPQQQDAKRNGCDRKKEQDQSTHEPTLWLRVRQRAFAGKGIWTRESSE